MVITVLFRQTNLTLLLRITPSLELVLEDHKNSALKGITTCIIREGHNMG